MTASPRPTPTAARSPATASPTTPSATPPPAPARASVPTAAWPGSTCRARPTPRPAATRLIRGRSPTSAATTTTPAARSLTASPRPTPTAARSPATASPTTPSATPPPAPARASVPTAAWPGSTCRARPTPRPAATRLIRGRSPTSAATTTTPAARSLTASPSEQRRPATPRSLGKPGRRGWRRQLDHHHHSQGRLQQPGQRRHADVRSDRHEQHPGRLFVDQRLGCIHVLAQVDQGPDQDAQHHDPGLGHGRPVTFVASAANKLVFAQQPTGAFANDIIVPAVTVQATDLYGNRRRRPGASG